MRSILLWVGLVVGAVVLGIWMTLTQRLAELGVDVWMSRVGVMLVAFFSVATIGVEEAAESIRSRRGHGKLIRSRRTAIEAGQVSVAAPPGELSLSPDSPEQ